MCLCMYAPHEGHVMMAHVFLVQCGGLDYSWSGPYDAAAGVERKR